jgi:ADP-heptose:LPS heptosyltransferase
VRYGGFGDMIQASSILPGLKAQGYRVTFFTTPRGKEIIEHDPNVDEWFIQDDDQVPNPALREFWDVQEKKFDKWVNLSESVEGALLAMPDRVPYFWPTHARDWILGANYLEFTHKLADVPCNYAPSFHESEKERMWARKEREKLNGKVILWTLSGSSVHKVWPYLDRILARIMITWADIKVVLCGDELSQLLEVGWENEPRVLKRCGKWSIRETLAFAKVADMVIGPETGVLNAVGFLPVPKIITMSHSSPQNLTRNWLNCVSLEPEGCECYPCHKMHYGFAHCARDEVTGVADCQAKISIEAMWEAIVQGLRGAEK